MDAQNGEPSIAQKTESNLTRHIQFGSAMQQQRSNTSTRLRKYLAPLILGCDQVDLVSSSRRSTKFYQRIGGVENEGKVTYDSWNVELLHDRYDGKFDTKKVFLGPVLMRVSGY